MFSSVHDEKLLIKRKKKSVWLLSSSKISILLEAYFILLFWHCGNAHWYLDNKPGKQTPLPLKHCDQVHLSVPPGAVWIQLLSPAQSLV